LAEWILESVGEFLIDAEPDVVLKDIEVSELFLLGCIE